MFKVGDKVRCIQGTYDRLVLGDVYKIQDIELGCFLINDIWRSQSRFELVEEENTTPLIQTFTDEEISVEQMRRKAVKRLEEEIKFGKIALEDLEKELELLRNQ